MMLLTTVQLATIITTPIVTILLLWTVVIFHKHHTKWGPYDIPIVTILILSIIRNTSIFAYTLIQVMNHTIFNGTDYCSVVVWMFNSIHTFQASGLTTLALIGWFAVQQAFWTSTQVVYHMVCLTMLCACVGVAGILAQKPNNDPSVICAFMPFDLDGKFNVFIVVLHVFLACVSLVTLLLIAYSYFCPKSSHLPSDYMKKSNSDLTNLSFGHTTTTNNNKCYYDTYTIQRSAGDYFEGMPPQRLHHHHHHRDAISLWNNNNSEIMSNVSTTVSSTNSRRPCIVKNDPGVEEVLEEEEEMERNRTGLETIHPVLIVSYLFYHLPLMVLCIYPKLIAPWPVAGAALWLGLVQDLLIPVSLGIVDSRFCRWVSNTYQCSNKHLEVEKLPHVGLDGKFRPFGSSQPQSLEIVATGNCDGDDRNRNGILSANCGFQSIEHRFPITNGSLYTSIDGRLPVLHNYRRHKEQRGIKTETHHQSSKMALQSAHLFGIQQQPKPALSCRNCEQDQSHANVHLSPNSYVNKHNFLQQQQQQQQNQFNGGVSLSQESLQLCSSNNNNIIMKNSRNLVRLNRMRLSKSEDSLFELNNSSNLRYQQFLPPVPPPPLQDQNKFRMPKDNNKKLSVTRSGAPPQDYYYTSDDDEEDDDEEEDEYLRHKNYDSLSSRSCCSITTEANCDFDFFQNKLEPIESSHQFDVDISLKPTAMILTSFKPLEAKELRIQLNKEQNNVKEKKFKITRSNSKRSLENFQAFVEQTDGTEHPHQRAMIHRSNSYMTLEDRQKRKRLARKLLRNDSKLSDCTGNIRQKIKSVEYLPSSNSSTVVYVEENLGNVRRGDFGKCVGSVPDLKKVFISEYI